MAQRKRPRYIDGDVQDAIKRLAIDTDWGPTQIERTLQAKAEFEGRLPKIRTFQDIVKEVRPPDPSGVWSVREADPETAGPVLETIAAMMVQTSGNVRSVTSGLAEWIVKVGTMCPDLSHGNVYRVAWLYNSRELNNEDTADLDAYLAFKPWRGGGRKVAYDRVIQNGWVTELPAVLTFSDDGNIESRDRHGFGEWLEELGFSVIRGKDSDHE